MRILWFTTSPSKGAGFLNYKDVGCSWVESLEGYLTQTKDIEIGIAFLWKGEKTEPYKIDKTCYFPIPVNPIKGKLWQFYYRWSHKIPINENVEKYLKVIHDFSPDIIHIFGTENDYGMLISKINIPCVVYIQGIVVMVNHKWNSGLTKRDVFKYSKKWPLIKGYGLFHLFFIFKKLADREKIIFKNSRFLIGRTDWDKRVSSIMSPNAEYFHCDEMMRENFYCNRWTAPKNKSQYVIISVIRNNIFKGLEVIYESQEILTKQYPELNIIWKVAGIQENDEVAYLIKRKYKQPFAEIGIQLLGPLQETELVSEMLNANLFVHPSHIENSPNSLCEAMLLGMPVIATYVGGVSSILTDKKEGILVQDGDPYSMAGAIVELIRNRNYADTLGTNARNKAIERHDPNKIADDIMSIYLSVVSKRPKKTIL